MLEFVPWALTYHKEVWNWVVPHTESGAYQQASV